MRIELPANKRLTHEMKLSVRWGDMDALGHVNNTVYFRYFESARIEYLRSLGSMPALAEQGFVIINAFCNFLKQLDYPREVLIKHYVGEIGTSSFDALLTLEPQDEPGVIYANGGATTVWIDFSRGKSTPLPDHIRAKLMA